jgi:hypothetical protein
MKQTISELYTYYTRTSNFLLRRTFPESRTCYYGYKHTEGTIAATAMATTDLLNKLEMGDVPTRPTCRTYHYHMLLLKVYIKVRC